MSTNKSANEESEWSTVTSKKSRSDADEPSNNSNNNNNDGSQQRAPGAGSKWRGDRVSDAAAVNSGNNAGGDRKWQSRHSSVDDVESKSRAQPASRWTSGGGGGGGGGGDGNTSKWERRDNNHDSRFNAGNNTANSHNRRGYQQHNNRRQQRGHNNYRDPRFSRSDGNPYTVSTCRSTWSTRLFLCSTQHLLLLLTFFVLGCFLLLFVCLFTCLFVCLLLLFLNIYAACFS